MYNFLLLNSRRISLSDPQTKIRLRIVQDRSARQRPDETSPFQTPKAGSPFPALQRHSIKYRFRPIPGQCLPPSVSSSSSVPEPYLKSLIHCFSSDGSIAWSYFLCAASPDPSPTVCAKFCEGITVMASDSKKKKSSKESSYGRKKSKTGMSQAC